MNPSSYFHESEYMEEWLRETCRGCRFENVKLSREQESGGYGCDLPVKAYCNEDVPEWSTDAPTASKYGVTCMKREQRPPSPLKGVKRGPRPPLGQGVLL